jgi:maltose alpha-D-glucosyltransferase / alpha-amylase
MEWLKTAVFYQIYPQSFYDSNADGIGDLPGIKAKLDYVQRLGVNALWLNPCFRSPFKDAGYDISNYYRVATRYGTNKDLKNLIDEVHRRGIRICLDLVPGHTSDQHPWFKASARPEPNQYSDRYIWTKNPWISSDGELKFITGTSDRMGAYAINFFSHQPALNYGFAHPERDYQQGVDDPEPQSTRRELKNIMKFWLDRGADGFRVDMAKSLIKKDPEALETAHLWQEIRHWMDTHYAERVLISEWGETAKAINCGFHVDFLLHFGVPGYRDLFFNEEALFYLEEKCYFDPRSHGDFNKFWQTFSSQREAVLEKGYLGLVSSNHDIARPACGPRTNEDLKVIFTFLLTWPAVPFIYYGDEIGMRFMRNFISKEGGYERTGSRTPMQWDGSLNAGFSRAEPDRIYLPIDPDPARPTVAEQEQDPNSLWYHVQNLIIMRKGHPDLKSDSPLEILSADSKGYPLVYQRGKELLVALNPGSDARTSRVALSGEIEVFRQQGCSFERRGGEIVFRLAGRSWGLFRRLPHS